MLIQEFINCYIFSSTKETNRSISKGVCFLLFDVFNGCSLVKKQIGKEMLNIYYWEKLTFSKLVGKVNFSEIKFEEYTSFNVYFGVTVFGSLPSTKLCLREKRPENAFLTLIVHYRKIVQKNKLGHPKQQ